MNSYADMDNDTQNWVKSSLALKITKEGLHDLVNSSLPNARHLSPGTTCCQCLTENILKCPTQGICSNTRNCKFHNTQDKMHRPCPSHTCDIICNEIWKLHTYRKSTVGLGPSWKNSNADRWYVNNWEIAKCFMPPEGYKNVSSFAETDFNGIISILINCTAFQQRLSFKVDTKQNILTQAREIGRSIRHSPQHRVTDSNLKTYFTSLTTLLSDPTYLGRNQKAQEAVLKLNKLQVEPLYKNKEDVREILDTVRIFVEKEKGEMMTECKNVIETGKEEIKRMETEVKHVIEKEKEEIKRMVTEGQHAIETGKGEIKQAVTEDLQRRLAKNYRKTLSCSPISPMVSDKDEILDMFYVAPKIVEKDTTKAGDFQQQTGTLVSSYRTLFCRDDIFVDNLYLIGEAGMGKSTFFTKCTIDWGTQVLHNLNLNGSSEHALEKNVDKEFQDVDVLAKFDFLFHVTLRNCGELCNLTEMITDQIIKKIYHADDDVAAGNEAMLSVLSNQQIKCLILADGLDEWSHPCKSKCSCTEDEKVVPFLSPTFDSTVMISSRPWRMAQHRVRDSKIDKYLEIEGAADTKSLVQKVICCLNRKTQREEKSNEFMSFIKKRDLPNLLIVPIVVTMLVCLWFEGVGESFSICEIYALMIDMMFGQKTLKEGYPEQEKTNLPLCFQNSKHIFKFKPALLSSAKLAFEQLFSMDKKSALVFKQVGSLSEKDKNIMLKTGIIRETKSQSFIMQSSSYSFIHKTVQEFLAALHLSYNPDEFHRVVEPFYNQAGEISDVSEVFIYICGLNGNIANQMSIMMCNTVPLSQTGVISPSNYIYTIDRPKYSVVDIVQRLIARGHIEACANKVANIHLNLHFFIFDHRTKNVSTLKSLLSMNAYQVRYMCIKRHEKVISDNEINEVFRHSKDTLSAFDMENRGGLNDMSTCRQLKHLRLSGKSIRNISTNAECLVSCKLFRLSIEVEKAVLHSLNSNELNVGIANRCSPLKHIEMNSIKNVDLFCETLPLLSQLKYLHINETNLCDHILHLPGTVTCVELLKVTMTSDAFHGLVKKIEESTHTVTCFLYSCTVKPNSDFENTKQYVRSCLKYTVLVDDIEIFSFKRSL